MNGQPVNPRDDDPDRIWEELYQPDVTALPPTPLSRQQKRSRRIALSVAGTTLSLLLLIGGGVALMVGSVFSLYTAIEQRDGAYLESHVDWAQLQPALRADLQRLASQGDAEGASSDAYLGRLIDTTTRAGRQPERLADILAARERWQANYGPIHPGLRDIVDSVQMLAGLEFRLDLIADPYTVVSGVSLCLRPSGHGGPGMRLITLGWPESGRHC